LCRAFFLAQEEAQLTVFFKKTVSDETYLEARPIFQKPSLINHLPKPTTA
jgi:hypothetical protein